MTVHCRAHNATLLTDATCKARKEELKRATRKMGHFGYQRAGWKAELEICRECLGMAVVKREKANS